jgi:tRNA pseudouridine38-40 synthase
MSVIEPIRTALLIEYDGTNYGGWQVQPGVNTVQQVMEGALAEAYGRAIGIVGSGRTDAGVHASGQVAHADLHGANIPLERIPIAMNVRLPKDIRVRAAANVAADFHARFDATEREYEYRIACVPSVFTRHVRWLPELPYSITTLTEAAPVFEGVHDFTTFSKLNPSRPDHRCDLRHCRVEHHGDHLIIRLRANRFVYGMVRSIVGALMDVARGRRSAQEIVDALAACDRALASPIAPAHGLTLNRVRYASTIFDEQSS